MVVGGGGGGGGGLLGGESVLGFLTPQQFIFLFKLLLLLDLLVLWS